MKLWPTWSVQVFAIAVAERLEEGGVPVGGGAGGRVRDGEAVRGQAGREAVGRGAGGDGPVVGGRVDQGVGRRRPVR